MTQYFPEALNNSNVVYLYHSEEVMIDPILLTGIVSNMKWIIIFCYYYLPFLFAECKMGLLQ